MKYNTYVIYVTTPDGWRKSATRIGCTLQGALAKCPKAWIRNRYPIVEVEVVDKYAPCGVRKYEGEIKWPAKSGKSSGENRKKLKGN